MTLLAPLGVATDPRAGVEGETVAVVGGGCAGTLVAAHFLRLDRRPRRLVIFEPGPEIGAGPAYGTDDPRLLLNAPVGTMSAFDDAPDHFATWLLARRRPYSAADFVPRTLYRRYLQDALAEQVGGAVAGTEVVVVDEAVTAVVAGGDPGGRAFALRLGSGASVEADRVVLALGAPPPAVVARLDVTCFGVVSDPWAPGALAAVPPGDVLLVGTGLTMVDVALALTGTGTRTVYARSRHGRLPAVHVDGGCAPWPAAPDFTAGEVGVDGAGSVTARAVVRLLRHHLQSAAAEGRPWQSVIGAARGAAPGLWASLAPTEKRRLLRHAGRRWELARHRMAPSVARAVTALRAGGRLDVAAGTVVDVVNEGSVDEPSLRVRLRSGGGRHEQLTVGAVIDCTGPGPDPAASSPLVADLLRRGLARPDPSGVGLDVDGDGALRGDQSLPVPVHVVGWLRRGAEFEATAVPEIRAQAQRLVRAVTRHGAGAVTG